MIAQGHNPAESGRGAEEVVRGLMDLEQGFINTERDYYTALGGGADEMTSKLAQLRLEQTGRKTADRPRESSLGELATSVAGGLASIV